MTILTSVTIIWASKGAVFVKNLSANAGDTGDSGSIPGSGRSAGGGHGLENLMDRRAWWATVHRVAKRHD